jgi:hypothetical protein
MRYKRLLPSLTLMVVSLSGLALVFAEAAGE